jgi:dynein heavy chain
LLFGIALFHATIQERKRYGALGFNKIYEWNPSDFSIAVKMLNIYLAQNETIPWDALRQMIGDVIYGGRVTDDWDRRCMNALLDKFLTPESLEDDVAFDPDRQYLQIGLVEYDALSDHVSRFPGRDTPAIFGFHPKALNALQMNQSTQMINWILGVQPKEAGGSAAARDDDTVLAMAEELTGLIPQSITIKGAHAALFEQTPSGRPNSLTVVLLQEVERYNTLLSVIHHSLRAVAQAIRGEIVMSIDNAELYRSLLNRQVPSVWKALSYPSTKPLAAWFKDFQSRVTFIMNWLRKGEPVVFWMPGLFFPQSFLTGILQNHSRKYQIPIDKLSFEAVIIPDDPDSLTRAPADGAYIHGLFFDGAAWDSNLKSLGDTETNAVYTNCPVIHIIPRPDFKHPVQDYLCPVYRTSERAGVLSTTGHSTNFVVALNVPTNEKPDKWILRGAALLLSTPY